MKEKESKVVKFNIPENANPYIIEQKVYDEMKEVMNKYDGQISYVAMLGIYELLKQATIKNQ